MMYHSAIWDVYYSLGRAILVSAAAVILLIITRYLINLIDLGWTVLQVAYLSVRSRYTRWKLIRLLKKRQRLIKFKMEENRK